MRSTYSDQRTIILALLATSAILLGMLVPGGPVENRDFSHINPGILGAFNIFLTVLDLGSIVLMYFVFKYRQWAYTGALIAAAAYFGVYAIDLAQIFPRSPSPMSQALALVEVLGMTVAVPLAYFSLKTRTGHFAAPLPDATGHALQTAEPAEFSEQLIESGQARSGLAVALVTLLVLSAVGIVFFATDAAMNSATGSVCANSCCDALMDSGCSSLDRVSPVAGGNAP